VVAAPPAASPEWRVGRLVYLGIVALNTSVHVVGRLAGWWGESGAGVLLLCTLPIVVVSIRARLRDIGDSPNRWWLAFVPLYNLYFGLRLVLVRGDGTPRLRNPHGDWPAHATIGIVVAAWIATQVPECTPRSTDALDAAIAHADDALSHARWDTPPGDNVRDVTNDALAKWPREPRILDVRARATDALLKLAVGRRLTDDDLPGALHLAHLANDLDPADLTAQHLVAEYESVAQRKTAEPLPAGTRSADPGGRSTPNRSHSVPRKTGPQEAPTPSP
jgi:hypothetical protein